MKTMVPPGAIRAQLVGYTECLAMDVPKFGDVVARSYAPVPLLARRLIAAGVNPDRPLEVYRGKVLALWFPTVRAAAKTRIRI